MQHHELGILSSMFGTGILGCVEDGLKFFSTTCSSPLIVVTGLGLGGIGREISNGLIYGVVSITCTTGWVLKLAGNYGRTAFLPTGSVTLNGPNLLALKLLDSCDFANASIRSDRFTHNMIPTAWYGFLYIVDAFAACRAFKNLYEYFASSNKYLSSFLKSSTLWTGTFVHEIKSNEAFRNPINIYL